MNMYIYKTEIYLFGKLSSKTSVKDQTTDTCLASNVQKYTKYQKLRIFY